MTSFTKVISLICLYIKKEASTIPKLSDLLTSVEASNVIELPDSLTTQFQSFLVKRSALESDMGTLTSQYIPSFRADFCDGDSFIVFEIGDCISFEPIYILGLSNSERPFISR